ncbi:putative FAD-binding monooxygenase [Actinoplanes italicus]|uniref:2-polyprenyl-6-methoxyphenol hydroxylase-like FAD-dependent oxidoreductase n=1 Tax=Actinoplanes italicus TaxID=113567 RepID=A0A2T0KJT4_9ACTN|nr:FAD-dependent monooxygenase [Actinoplanes italicus]PRX23791.1 2-polyprenyl-6-methoxyphenol hydroxylase-like FAD-dependent oxidoreductase [Actinoplanes italicus]GIE30292.1 putative FAD-binding monooxygenase [Actinoplanes italicus]
MFTESRFTIIVGAGPTGLTLARQLDRHGVPYRIVERSPKLFDGSRGKGLQPRTLEVLDDLGLISRFLDAGGDYPALLAHLPDGGTHEFRLDEPHDPAPSVPYPNMLMVPQWRTSELLAEGIPVELGTGVTGLTQLDGGVRVTLDSGEIVDARYVVGADGGRSTVRKLLGIGFEGETHEEERLFIADVRLTGLDRDHWHVWPGPERTFRLGLCPLPGTDWFQLTAPPSPLSPAELVAAADPSITVTEVGWTSEFRANIRMASRFRTGNVFLAGDAAHVHSPAGGQGLNTGIQDAYNLGWKIATGSSAVLDTYEEERLPVAASVLGISTRLHRRHVDGDEDAMRRDDPALRQLSLHYRGTTLAAEHRTDPGAVRAGDRAPDAPLPHGRVFDLLRGAHATLLAFGWTGPLPELPVPAHHVTEAAEIYDTTGPTLVLVRPDNYIGCVTRDPADVLAYLRRQNL